VADYGLHPSLHRMKVGPWTVRLRAATAYLEKGIRTQNGKMVLFGLEDTSFWMGRVTCDAIGAAEDTRELAPFRQAAFAVMKAAEAIARGKSFMTPKKRPDLGGIADFPRIRPWVFFLLMAALVFRRPGV
jgi:hypothetical protein